MKPKGKSRKIIAAGAAGAASLLFAFPAFAAGRPAQLGFQATFGIVEAVGEDSFVLTEKRPEGDATVVVSLTEDTAFKKSGIVDGAVDIAPGVQVVVRGTPDEAGLIATSVNVMPS